MNKYFFSYICIFVTLRRKSSILNTRLVFFLQHKKNSDFKINMPENKSFSFFYFIFKSRSGRVTCLESLAQASDPAGHKRALLKFKES